MPLNFFSNLCVRFAPHAMNRHEPLLHLDAFRDP